MSSENSTTVEAPVVVETAPKGKAKGGAGKPVGVEAPPPWFANLYDITRKLPTSSTSLKRGDKGGYRTTIRVDGLPMSSGVDALAKLAERNGCGIRLEIPTTGPVAEQFNGKAEGTAAGNAVRNLYAGE
jgi:hypothetical protein